MVEIDNEKTKSSAKNVLKNVLFNLSSVVSE